MLITGKVTNGTLDKNNTIEVKVPQLFGDNKIRAIVSNSPAISYTYKEGDPVLLGFLTHDPGQPVVLGLLTEDFSFSAQINSDAISYRDNLGNTVTTGGSQSGGVKSTEDKTSTGKSGGAAGKTVVDNNGNVAIVSTQDGESRDVYSGYSEQGDDSAQFVLTAPTSKESWFRNAFVKIASDEIGYYEKGEECENRYLYDNAEYGHGYNSYTKYHKDLSKIGFFGQMGSNWCGGPNYPYCLYFVMWCLSVVALYYLDNKTNLEQNNYSSLPGAKTLRTYIRDTNINATKKDKIQRFVYGVSNSSADEKYTGCWLKQLENKNRTIIHYNLNIQTSGLQIGDVDIRDGHIKIICHKPDRYGNDSTYPTDTSYDALDGYNSVYCITGNTNDVVGFQTNGISSSYNGHQYYVAKLLWGTGFDILDGTED